ncbi:MAG: hypothetical protein H6702_14040 [Myxococcales bacterium]|nr:hypothetical protein [Myxococcales bacterium]
MLPPIPQGRPVTSEDVDALIEAMRRGLRGFDVRFKDESWLQRAIARAVRPFNRHYLSSYTTVMFGKIYFPSRRWYALTTPFDLYALLRHEAVHLRDAQRFPVLFELSYLLCLPVGVTARAGWEWRGYAETFRVWAAVKGEIPDWLIESTAERFTGADYLYMWPFPQDIRRRLIRLRRRLVPG